MPATAVAKEESPPTASPRTSSRPSSSASSDSRRRRRRSPTISATSMREAKGNGYDVKALRTIVRLRKQDNDERQEQEAILETYMHALGMLTDV